MSKYGIYDLLGLSEDKPIFLYLTSDRTEDANATKNIDGTCFKDERVMLGSSFYHLVKLSWTSTDARFTKYVGKAGMPVFAAFSRDGKRVGLLKKRYSPSKIYDLMTRASKKDYKTSIKSVVSKVQKALTQIDKVDAAIKSLDGSARPNLSGRQKAALEKKRKQLADKMAKLVKDQEKIWEKVVMRKQRKSATE